MSKQTKKKTAAPAPLIKSNVDYPAPAAGKGPLFFAGILAAIAVVLYLPTLGHGFVLDDPLVINMNKFVQQGFGGLGNIFSHSYRAGAAVSTDSEYMYRPLSVAFFAIEWAVSPNTPGMHHFMNVLWYGLSVGLLFLMLRRMLGEQWTLVAFGAALLFAVHPIHTEVVANIKSRDEILSFFFGTLTLYWLWDAASGQMKKLWWALVAFFLALLAKEGAATMVVIAPLALYFFHEKKTWRTALPMLGVFLLWFMIRFLVMGKTSYTPNFNDNQLVAATLSDRWATGFVALGRYLQLLVWPSNLSWDYSFNQIPTVGWGNVKALLFFGTYAGILLGGIWGFSRRNVLAFCGLAFLASIGLYSNLFLLIGTVFGERLVYQGSAWFCLAAAFVLSRLLKVQPGDDPEKLLSGKNAVSFVSVIGVLGLLGMGATFVRNPAWKSNYTLVTTDRAHVPNSFRVQQSVGEETLLKYVDKQTPPTDTAALLQQALEGFEISYSIRPTFNNLLGMGNVAYFRKDYAKAADYFTKSYEMQPGSMATERLATVYREWGRYEGQVKNNLSKAVEYLEKSYRYDSTEVQTQRDLGAACGMMQQPAKAVYYLERAVKKDPKDETLLRNLALARQQLAAAPK